VGLVGGCCGGFLDGIWLWGWGESIVWIEGVLWFYFGTIYEPFLSESSSFEIYIKSMFCGSIPVIYLFSGYFYSNLYGFVYRIFLDYTVSKLAFWKFSSILSCFKRS